MLTSKFLTISSIGFCFVSGTNMITNRVIIIKMKPYTKKL